MRLLVCEFITGGGLLNAELPTALAREGELMLQQVLADMRDCTAVQHVDVLRDPRLSPIDLDKCSSVPVNLDFPRTFSRSCEQVDGVLLIAPESEQVLLKLTEVIENSPARSLGSHSAAVALATSKRATSQRLGQAGIPVVPVYTASEAALMPAQTWVIKPDDGVSGGSCRCVTAIPPDLAANMIIQPYTCGKAASLTLLCAEDDCALVAINEQYIQLDEQGCRLSGINVNGLELDYRSMQQLALAVTAAIPGLWGWAGIDLLITDKGPRILEVNPRMTTPYAGLRRSLGANPADWLMRLAKDGELPDTASLLKQAVEVLV